jgi:cell division protein FtsQ
VGGQAYFQLPPMVRTQEPPTDDPLYRRGRADRNSLADGPLPPKHAKAGRAWDSGLPLDGGLTDADDPDEPQQFRRAARRVPVKRGALALPRRIASRVKLAVLLLLGVAALGTVAYQVREFALHSGRFRLRSERDIELAGQAPNSSGPVMERMREALGRNVFLISMDERKRELEKIPWVESATVMRLWPNRLRVEVKERTPVAYVAMGDRIGVIDAQGVVMDLSPGAPADYSFPVIRGMAESDPLSTRAARMKMFARLLRELDGDGGQSSESATAGKVRYSRNLEEVELSDPEDVKIMVKGPSGPILLHLGNENFLQRFMVYLSNVQKWEQERGKLESVDLRYGRQVILNPDMSAALPVTAPTVTKKAAPPSAASLAHTAGPAASRIAAHPKPAAARASKAGVGKTSVARTNAAKKSAAHSRPRPSKPTAGSPGTPQRATAKQRTWRGKKPT